MTDQEREKLIEAWRVTLELDPDTDVKQIAAGRMRDLIAQRPDHQVERMERERGLRP